MEIAMQQHDRYLQLKETLGSEFDLSTSMGCALESAIKLSPDMEKIQPNLFSELLPSLHDSTNDLTLTLYVRTGHTENVAIDEHKFVDAYIHQAQQIVNCAMEVEKATLTAPDAKMVWLVVSDSPLIKTWMADQFASQQRKIVFADTRGAHTRNRASPSTVDVAEAVLDWWLIAEASDAVVTDYKAPSFANTASFRTARPMYKVPKERDGDGLLSCERIEPVLRWPTVPVEAS